MGTPGFAAASLKRLAAWPRAHIVAVYTQPDRPAGRGQKLAMSAVKKLALELGIPVCQPASLKGAEAQAELASFRPYVLAVAAYGLILPDAVLDMPRLAPVNVHASLLPKYRGAAPIQRAVMNGDAQTGIAIMRMEAGLDTGPVYAMRGLPIGPDATAGDIHDALACLGGELLLESLPGIAAGELAAAPQNDAAASYAPKLCKEDGRIDFNKTVREVHNQVRGVSPWPGAWCELKREGENAGELIRVRVCPGKPAPPEYNAEYAGMPPGTVLGVLGDSLAIQCADGAYLIPEVCPANSKMMAALDFACGYLNQAEACQAVFLDHA